MNDLAERPDAELRGPVNMYDPTLENFTEQMHDRIRRDLSSLGTVISIGTGAVIHSMSKGTFVDSFKVSVEHPRLRIPIVFTVSWDDKKDEIIYTTATGRVYQPVRTGYGHGPMEERGEEMVDKLFAALDRHRAITSTEEWKPGMYPPPPRGNRISPGATRRNYFEHSTGAEIMRNPRTGELMTRKDLTGGGKAMWAVAPERKPVRMKANTFLAGTGATVASTVAIAAAGVDPLSFLALLSIPLAGGITAMHNNRVKRHKEELEDHLSRVVEAAITPRSSAVARTERTRDDHRDDYTDAVHAIDMLYAEHRKAVADWNQDRFQTLAQNFENTVEMTVFTEALMKLCDARGVEYMGKLSVTDKVVSAKHLTRPKTELLDEPAYSLKGTIRTYLVGFQGEVRGEGVARWIYFDGRHLFETVQGSGENGNPFHRKEAAICPL